MWPLLILQRDSQRHLQAFRLLTTFNLNIYDGYLHKGGHFILLDGRSTLLVRNSVVTVKGIVQPKMKMMSSFTRPQVVPNLYEFLSSHIVCKKNTM